MTRNAVTKPAETSVAPVGDFSQNAGVGFEGTGADDYAIPFLQILQGLSPQVKRSDGAYIEGAQEGMIYNTVTKAVIDPEKKPMTVIPVAYRHTYVEWRVREKGGGFVAEHTTPPSGDLYRDDKGRDILPNGNQLNDTRTFYVLVLDDEVGGATPAVITMTSTQIKKAKQWLMQQNMLKLKGANGVYTPPMMASKWVVTTVPESNEKGSWYGWKFEHGGYLAGPSDPLFVDAMAFHESVKSGATRVDLGKMDPETGEPVKGNRPPPSGDVPPGDRDVPF